MKECNKGWLIAWLIELCNIGACGKPYGSISRWIVLLLFFSKWPIIWFLAIYTMSVTVRRLLGNNPCKVFTEISASFWPARLPRSRWDLGEILKSRRDSRPRSQRDLKISAAKNSPRFSPRTQNLVEILAEISTLKISAPKTRQESRQDFKKDLSEISKSRRPKPRRESRQDVKWDLVEISKSWRQCFQDILKCQYSYLGKRFINSLTEVVSNRQNKHTEIRLLTTC